MWADKDVLFSVPRVFSESDAVLMKLCFKHYNEGLEVIFNRFQKSHWI